MVPSCVHGSTSPTVKGESRISTLRVCSAPSRVECSFSGSVSRSDRPRVLQDSSSSDELSRSRPDSERSELSGVTRSRPHHSAKDVSLLSSCSESHHLHDLMQLCRIHHTALHERRRREIEAKEPNQRQTVVCLIPHLRGGAAASPLYGRP